MYKLKIVSIGKTKESWLKEAIEEYSIRLQSLLSFEWVLAKDQSQLERLVEKEKTYVALDPQGEMFSSEAFSRELFRQLEKHASRLTFVIGGDEGLSRETKNGASKLISLSPLTFTHQMTRLILVEQIYRAFEIAKGSSYHK